MKDLYSFTEHIRSFTDASFHKKSSAFTYYRKNAFQNTQEGRIPCFF